MSYKSTNSNFCHIFKKSYFCRITNIRQRSIIAIIHHFTNTNISRRGLIGISNRRIIMISMRKIICCSELCHCHFILSKCTCFVCTNNGTHTQRLNRSNPSYKSILFEKLFGGKSKSNCNYCHQSFWNTTDRKTDNNKNNLYKWFSLIPSNQGYNR